MLKTTIYILASLLITFSAEASHHQFSKIEQSLLNENVTSIVNLADFLRENGVPFKGSSESYVVAFESGIRAVHKPDRKSFYSTGERAAYLISEHLDLGLVPPTVIREIDGKIGSLQYFVEWALEANKVAFETRWACLSKDQRANVELFYFVLGQHDRHSGNILVGTKGEVFMIDNGKMMIQQRVRYGHAPFIRAKEVGTEHSMMDHSDTFPFDHVKKLVNPTLQELTETFSPYLNDYTVGHTWRKLQGGEYPNNEVPFAFWDGAFWFQRAKAGPLGVDYTDHYPISTMAALNALEFDTLRNLLPDGFSDRLIIDLLERRDQILENAK